MRTRDGDVGHHGVGAGVDHLNRVGAEAGADEAFAVAGAEVGSLSGDGTAMLATDLVPVTNVKKGKLKNGRRVLKLKLNPRFWKSLKVGEPTSITVKVTIPTNRSRPTVALVRQILKARAR